MRGKWIPFVMATALFVACSQPAEKERLPRPVKLTQVASLNEVEKSFSGVVSADQFSDLAFKMSGPLIALRVEEGQRVRRGQIVAEIDPLDCQLEYEAKRSMFQTAEAQLQRAKRLLEKQAISRQEFETTEASYSNADGFIQKKYVENYQKVQAGQGIVCLINPEKLQVQFTMPESNMVYYNSPHSLYVEFDNYKGMLFKAKLKEYVEASPDGSGVPVFLYLDDERFNLDTYKVAVGFACRIILKVNDTHSQFGEAVTVPLSAVVSSETDQQRFVFVYDPTSQAVKQRTIEGEVLINQDQLIVTGGLKAGEQIVVAGATRLIDGQVVRVLTD